MPLVTSFTVLHSFDMFVRLLKPLSFPSHFLLCCSIILFLTCSSSSAMRSDVGSVFRKSSLSCASAAASAGRSGRKTGTRPAGTLCLDEPLAILRSSFSPATTLLGGGNLKTSLSSSTSLVKPGQLAFARFTYVRFWVATGTSARRSRITIGRWSEFIVVHVAHWADRRSDKLPSEMSGDVDCPVVGSLVGSPSFSTAWLELEISSANLSPRWSLMDECHKVSWALKSPRTRESGSSNRWAMEGL